MTVRKTIANKAFGGRQVFRRAPYPKIQVIATGTASSTKLGTITYSVATTGCYLAVNTAGTGTKFNV
jgi:hypothetical protein